MEQKQEHDTYIIIMIQSLGKKIGILNQIVQINQVQKEELDDPNLMPEDFDKTVTKKAELIEELEKLDLGFEELYKKVKEELINSKEAYKTDIKKMQELIHQITDKSMMIQSQEKRNKMLMEKKFNSIHRQAKEVRKSQKIVNQYYKNMMKNNYVDPQFMDNKK